MLTILLVLLWCACVQSHPLSGLIHHPNSDTYPPPSGSFVVVMIADTSGPFASENTQCAMGALIWRDYVNSRGGLCIGGGPTDLSCTGGKRMNVSVIIGDIMKGGSPGQRSKLYFKFYTDICRLPQSQLPHAIVTPFSSSPSGVALAAVHNSTGTLNPCGCNVLVPTLASSTTILSSQRRFAFTPLPTPEQTIGGSALLFGKYLSGRAKTVAIISKDGDILSNSFTAGSVKMIEAGLFGPDVKIVGRRCDNLATDSSSPVCISDADCGPGVKCVTPRFQSMNSQGDAIPYALGIISWVKTLADTKADIFIVGGHIEDTSTFMQGLKIAEWSPLAAYSNMPMAMSRDILNAPSEGWFGNSLLLPDYGFGQTGQYLGTSSQYCELVQAMASVYFDPYMYKAGLGYVEEYFYAGMATDALIMAQRAVERASTRLHWDVDFERNATTFDALVYEIEHLGTCSATPIGFESMGVSCATDSDCSQGTCQPFETMWGAHSIVNGINTLKRSQTFQIIPCSAGKCMAVFKSNGSIVSPVPKFPSTWPWDTKWIPYAIPAWLSNLVYALIAISCVVSVAVAVVIVTMRHTATVKASSITFMMTMVASTVMSSLSALVYISADPSSTICDLRVISPSIDATLIFVPLALKTWRIMRIFQSKVLRVVRMSDAQLGLAMIAYMTVHILVMTGVSSGWPSMPYVQRVEESGSFIEYTLCKASWPLVTSAIMFAAGIMGAGLYMGWRVRLVESDFNESSHIAQGIFMTSAYAVIIILLVFIVDSSASASVLVRCVGIILCPHLAIQPIVMPKILTAACRTKPNDHMTVLSNLSHERAAAPQVQRTVMRASQPTSTTPPRGKAAFNVQSE